MTLESSVRTLLLADSTLTATLTGGIFAKESTGVQGISRDTTPTAFDASGYLKPCALVRARDLTPDGNVQDGLEGIASAFQVVEVWVYADAGAGYTAIDSAVDRIYALLQGYRPADAFPYEWAGTITHQRDTGVLNNAGLSRIDFAVYSVVGA